VNSVIVCEVVGTRSCVCVCQPRREAAPVTLLTTQWH